LQALDKKTSGSDSCSFHYFYRGSLLVPILLFLFSLHSYSQGIITDRPDQTESAVTVPLKSLQVETGFLYETFVENNFTADNYSIAGTLLRYGLFEKIELRLGAGYLINEIRVLSNKGIGDLFLGTKINFLTEDKNLFDFGLLIHAALPFGSEFFKPEKLEPELIASLAKSLSEKFSIGFNFGGTHDSSIDEIVYLYTTSLGYSLSDNLSAFVEVFGNFSSSFKPDHLYDGGLTYLLSDTVQLDLSGGKRINNKNSYWFIGTGFSFRLDSL
jgi:hypothetical protein